MFMKKEDKNLENESPLSHLEQVTQELLQIHFYSLVCCYLMNNSTQS